MGTTVRQAREAVAAPQTIKKWGNGLGMRITAALARAAHIESGTPVHVEVVDEGLLVRVVGKPKRTLEARLAAYDPDRHGGQFAGDGLVGIGRF
ncbi:PbsX family transcriptional regulator [Variovorax sp.]|jgi:antitoxin MazE|uniref:AbrB/MazE/SpoVT family DNA-binding domain-containing protein n=1 Tax=Variovorax sp. TaxID=1871043 RepID=UPI000C547AF9|nr:PbsX family transcriptional regulator [Variovorax sp.]MBS76183.1 PbsX family transcriptional regulator [Variovorax sp.]MBS80613.1 PbsX family transcriptional regulator [Variovorax sp.]